MTRLKVSREGLELIKSFEGFRPRAERLEDGRWVIGHGHTLSAREGAEVGPEEAELLLQYDLLPVLEAIRANVPGPLNQHQVDALASFVLDVGVERFLASDVAARLNVGEVEGAARALAACRAGPARPPAPDSSRRRRAAEGALFLHDPHAGADLAALLNAPVEGGAEPAPRPEPQETAASEARAKAVAVLLGEGDAEEAPEVVVPVFAARAEDDEPAPVREGVPAPESANENGEVPETDPLPPEAVDEAPTSPAGRAPIVASTLLTLQRYTPYAVTPFGLAPKPANTMAEDAVAAPVETPAPDPETLAEPEPRSEAEIRLAPEPDSGTDPAPEPEAAIETVYEPLLSPALTPSDGGVLILTPPPEVEPDAPAREAWPESARSAPVEEEPLFIEDPAARLGAVPVFRPEEFDAGPRSGFDWSEKGAFLGMGAVGLTAFGAAIVGFRMAAARPTASVLDETTLVSGVLALIGALCVGVSAYNLYRGRGRSGAD